MNDTKINGSVTFNPSSSQKVHDLTMLYLKNQNLSGLSIDYIAQKYIDTSIQFNSSLNSYRKSLKGI